MEQDALDHALVAGAQGAVKYTNVGQIIVTVHDALEPSGLFAYGLGIVVLEQVLNAASADGDMDDADLNAVWQFLHHGPAEVVGWCQAREWTAEWWSGGVPFIFLTCLSVMVTLVGFVIYCGHHLKTGINPLVVLGFWTCRTFHVRLSDTDVDVEIGVRVRPETIRL